MVRFPFRVVAVSRDKGKRLDSDVGGQAGPHLAAVFELRVTFGAVESFGLVIEASRK